ncbi:MAG TPA: hypothetical protein VII91_10375 [Bauldia sp.]
MTDRLNAFRSVVLHAVDHPADLTRKADAALYRCKAENGDFTFYD